MRPTSSSSPVMARIADRSAVVGIVGLGYVGLPLLLEFHRQGFSVIGFDTDLAKIDALRAGRTYIKHIEEGRVLELSTSLRFQATNDPALARESDALILCVPTPLTANREPDMSYIVKTAQQFGPHIKRGCVVSLESTTYPGTTEEVLLPELERLSGMKGGVDFHVAYSPEREDPSNKEYSTATIPKVVGGLTHACLAVAQALYDTVVVRTVPVSSCGAAEATKLVENIFRCVNIAMVNELKMVFHRMNIDVWEVIEAAKTKPFGYMPFYPGPGLGGHCIPIDPFYLTWKAREFDMPTKFIELAGEINAQMPYYVVGRLMEALNDQGRALRGSRILILGLAYKPDVDDLRESPTFKLMHLLEARGAAVDFHDPHIAVIPPTREHPEYAGRRSVGLEGVAQYDAVLVSTAHSAVDHAKVAKEARLVIDTRNAVAKALGHAMALPECVVKA